MLVSRSVARRSAAAAKKVLEAAGAHAASVPQAMAVRALPRSCVVMASSTTRQVRMCSSSRFLSLADDDDEKRSRRNRGDNDDGDDEDGSDEKDELEDGEVDDEDAEDVDGQLNLDDEIDINAGGVDMDEELDDLVMELYLENPLKWTPEVLARKFHLSKPRVEAIIYLKGEEAGYSPEEFKAKIDAAKEAATAAMEADAAALAAAEAKGDEKEIRRLQKRMRQEAARFDDDHEEADEEWSAHDEAVLMGVDEDAYRNPDFFFLNDEFEGFPPLVRRMGKHASTDKLYPEEALAIQKMAENNKVVLQKSFAKPTNVKGKWRIAVKDISKTKKPLYVRDETKTLRLATDEELLPRTWVRRPSFFSGIPK